MTGMNGVHRERYAISQYAALKRLGSALVPHMTSLLMQPPCKRFALSLATTVGTQTLASNPPRETKRQTVERKAQAFQSLYQVHSITYLNMHLGLV